jgi:hypothetical protein
MFTQRVPGRRKTEGGNVLERKKEEGRDFA